MRNCIYSRVSIQSKSNVQLNEALSQSPGELPKVAASSLAQAETKSRSGGGGGDLDGEPSASPSVGWLQPRSSRGNTQVNMRSVRLC